MKKQAFSSAVANTSSIWADRIAFQANATRQAHGAPSNALRESTVWLSSPPVSYNDSLKPRPYVSTDGAQVSSRDQITSPHSANRQQARPARQIFRAARLGRRKN